MNILNYLSVSLVCSLFIIDIYYFYAGRIFGKTSFILMLENC